MNLIQFINENNLDQFEELIFFGGSFNPWHEGHSECLRLLKNSTPVIVIPDHNPYKELITDKNLDIEKLNSTVQTIRDNTYLFDGFYFKNEKNPTSHWISELKNEFKNIKRSLLIGFDTFNSLEKWINAKELLLNLDKLYIASRLEHQGQREKQIQTLKTINKDLGMIFLGNHEFEELSSSKLRTKI